MILDLIAQADPSMGAVMAAGVAVILLLATYLDPELVEVYLGDAQLVATLALTFAVLIFLSAALPDATQQQFADRSETALVLSR